MNTDDLALVRAGAPRRRLLGGFVAGALAIFGLSAGGAAGKRKKKRKKKAKPRADARCPGPPDIPALTATGYRFGQTFTARQSGKLVRAQVMVNTNAGEDADWLVQIVDVDLDGLPTETVLATATIANATLPDGPVTLTANFSPPANVVVNRGYALVLGWTGMNQFSFPVHSTNPCGGRLHSKDIDGPGPYNPAPARRDLVYTTFIKT